MMGSRGVWAASVSRGACDATVAVVDREGRVVRHLASGVLGKNAPYPFRQGSLGQTIEWDGTDDMGQTVPEGCSVRVSLGLKPVVERNILWDAYSHKLGFAGFTKKKGDTDLLVAKGNDGTVYVASHVGSSNARYDTDYWARTFIPANTVHSVMVLDANGNRVARLGKYGNVDDTDADVKAGRDGLRFAWIRSLAVSDRAFYAVDHANHRILKAKLIYGAEEAVGL